MSNRTKSGKEREGRRECNAQRKASDGVQRQEKAKA